MREVVLDVANDTVLRADEEILKRGSVNRYIDWVKSLMGPELTSRMERFRQKRSPSSLVRAFDFGGAFIFLPTYWQAEEDLLGIDWSKADPELVIQDLLDHLVPGKGGMIIDDSWSRDKIAALGPAMTGYYLVGARRMRESGSPADYRGFCSGSFCMTHLAVSQVKLARVRKMFPQDR